MNSLTIPTYAMSTFAEYMLVDPRKSSDLIPVARQPNYEPRMMAQPLPLSTTRALQELEDLGATLPKHGLLVGTSL